MPRRAGAKARCDSCKEQTVLTARKSSPGQKTIWRKAVAIAADAFGKRRCQGEHWSAWAQASPAGRETAGAG